MQLSYLLNRLNWFCYTTQLYFPKYDTWPAYMGTRWVFIT